MAPIFLPKNVTYFSCKYQVFIDSNTIFITFPCARLVLFPKIRNLRCILVKTSE